MSAIVTVRTARKEHMCSRCGEVIKPGEQYEASSLPPGDNDIGNLNWWHLASHVGSYLRPGHVATRADHQRLSIGCDEAAAYREKAEREEVWPRAETDCACRAAGVEECPCEADGPDGLCTCCRTGDHRGSCASVALEPRAGEVASDA